jgi:choline dehydrogenase
MGFCRTHPALNRPDVELLFTPADLDARIWFPGWRGPRGRTIAVAGWLLRPKRRGWVRLHPADPLAPPRSQFNLLAEPEDPATLLRALHLIRTSRQPIQRRS